LQEGAATTLDASRWEDEAIDLLLADAPVPLAKATAMLVA
jgi:hypothetical protein